MHRHRNAIASVRETFVIEPEATLASTARPLVHRHVGALP
jgi:hypothetical protein